MMKRRRSHLAWTLAAAILAAGPSLATETVTHPFFGVTHIDRTETTPRPLKMHIMEIDLDEPALRFLATPQSGPRNTTNQTTLQFLTAQAAQIAINAHFFTPWPADGTGTSWLTGLAASSATNGPNGHAYAPFDVNLGYPYQDNLPAMNISADNVATVVYQAAGDPSGYATDPPLTPYNAISGNEQILTNGVNTAGTGSWDATLNPRTIIGTAPGNTLVLFVLDGRQTGISEGMTTSEVADLLRNDYGVTDAINLDGGGSATLALADPTPRVVNVPVGDGTPGSERSVGSNLGVFARACSPETEGARCGDDGDPCNGELVCHAGACVDDTGVTAVDLVPLSASGYRARDIADNNYAARFYTKAGHPDYEASDYDRAKVTVTFKRSGPFLEGSLDASGLKPNFAYQIKLVGMPTAEYGAAGDDVSNERIGSAGRWNRVGVGNATDAEVQACNADPQCEDVFEGYLAFDFFITDRYGEATHPFVADDSFHVLWRDCPPGRSMSGCQAPGGRPTVSQDVVALASTGYGYDQDAATWRIGVFGEVERTAPQSYLPQGEYRSRFVLTEESFHESGTPGGYWATAIGEAGIHFWINQTAGPRDCGDWDLCNGYESCDAGGACQTATAGPCDDHDLCTDDACDAESGCSHAFNTAPCEDGDVCTANDTCSVGTCVPSGNGSCGIGGTVYYYRDAAGEGSEPSSKPVPNVGIDRTQDAISEATTDGTGAYALSGAYGDVTVGTVPKYGDPRASDHNGGISSFDASVVARSAVQLVVLSPNQRIAGDVSGDGTVSSFDASMVSRFAVGLVDHFDVAIATGSDWLFRRCDAYAFPGDPGCGTPTYSFTPIAQAETARDFYAILYGDVTGNWLSSLSFGSASAPSGTSPEEAEATAADERLAKRLGGEGTAVRIERSPASSPADLSLSGWTTPLHAGERRHVTVDLRRADGILGLDLVLEYDPSRIAVVGVEPVGLGSGYGVAHAQQAGRCRIAAYGVVPLSGSGSVLTVTVEALRDTGRQMPLGISGVANEGRIPLRVRGRIQAARTR